MEKERQDGTKTIEAKICLVGDVEELIHKIRKKTPTTNNKSLKILLSKVSYLQQAKELEDNGFYPLKTDPALFIHKSEGQSMCNAVSTIHGKDLFMAGKQSIMTDTQQGLQEKFEVNPGDDLPRFSGFKYKWGPQGEMIVDHQHLVDSLEMPDLSQLDDKGKRHILNPNLQLV